MPLHDVPVIELGPPTGASSFPFCAPACARLSAVAPPGPRSTGPRSAPEESGALERLALNSPNASERAAGPRRLRRHPKGLRPLTPPTRRSAALVVISARHAHDERDPISDTAR